MTQFNETEQEAVILYAMWTIIDDMVNYEMFEKIENLTDVTLMFSSSTHKRLFNVLLCDFLSQLPSRGKEPLPFDLPAPPSGSRPSDLTHLYYLRQVCKSPRLGSNADPISHILEAFASWLEADAIVKRVWLPSISVETDIKIRRIEFLKICGDIAKHNFLRLPQNVKRICDVLKFSGHQIDERQAYQVLPEFYEWFHTNIFTYHSSTIAEFLNNLRLGIFTYLQTEYTRAHHAVASESTYRFDIPAEIQQPIARAMYWDLMNLVRGQPYMPRFVVTPYLKMRY